MASDNADSFARRVDGIVRDVAVAQGLYIGSQLGIFTAMLHIANPFSPEQLAEATKCKPVLIREWLLQMTSSGIVKLESPEDYLFSKDEHQIQALTSDLCWINSTMKALMVFAKQNDDLVECMRIDGPKKMTNDLRRSMDGERNRKLGAMLPDVIDAVPELPAMLGQGCRVLDVGCNKGGLLIHLAKRYPKSEFVGVDPWREVIDDAVRAAQEGEVTNVSFYAHDGMELPPDWTDTFDYVISVKTLHHIPDGVKASSEIRRVLKPGRYLSVIELRRDNKEEVNIQRDGAPVFHLFNMMTTASGHNHGHHGHGHHGHGHHDHTHTRDIHDNKNDDGSPNADHVDDLKVAFTGGHHGHSHQGISAMITEGGFSAVQMMPVPRVDFLDQIHLLAH